MKFTQIWPLLVLCIMVSCNRVKTNPIQTSLKPNVLVVLVDDLGFSDLGCYGGEIRTPNIDKLAKDGLLNTSFYAAPTCSPSRASLLTGVDYHKNGLGTMAGDWSENQKGEKGYEGYLNFDVVTFPKLLQNEGYHTSISGKWHLSFPITAKEQWPNKRGFDRSFTLMQGGGGHFYDKQPMLSYMKEAFYVEDGATVDKLPKDFYSSSAYVDKSITYIKESIAKKKPFFHYLAFTAPHWPLQVPDEYLNLYKGRYNKGYEFLAKERFKRMQSLGIIPKEATLPSLPPNVKPWGELSIQEQIKEAKNMEIYAAMIEVMDKELGRLINYLKDEDIYKETTIIFMSDNGAEGNSILTYADTADWIDKNFDNSIENAGRINSYLQLGPAWGHVASLPFKWYKSFAHEGGVRVPAIIYHPQTTIDSSVTVDQYLSIKDIAPTILEIAKIEHPDTLYQGRKIHSMDGTSMLPWLQGKSISVHDKNEAHCWELFGRIGVRLGDWKAEKIEAPYGNGEWELYNLKEDISEQQNKASHHPDKLKELVERWKIYEKENNVILPNVPTAYAKETYWRGK